MGPTWGPSGADRTQVGPMLAPWTLLSGYQLTQFYLTPKVNVVSVCDLVTHRSFRTCDWIRFQLLGFIRFLWLARIWRSESGRNHLDVITVCPTIIRYYAGGVKQGRAYITTRESKYSLTVMQFPAYILVTVLPCQAQFCINFDRFFFKLKFICHNIQNIHQ